MQVVRTVLRWMWLGLRSVHKTIKVLEPWGITIAIIGFLVTMVGFIFELEDRQAERTFRAWEVILSAQEAGSGSGSSVRQALEYLSRENEDGLFCADWVQWVSVKLSANDRRACLVPVKRRESFFEVDLSGAVLIEARLRGANLHGADLSGANMSKADFIGAILSKADLSQSDLTEAKLSEAKLVGTELIGAELLLANLSGANLSSANLQEASLSQVDLSSANLTEANLSGADLNNANLTGADLRKAKLPGANLVDANLSEVKLGAACGDEETILPPHLGISLDPCE